MTDRLRFAPSPTGYLHVGGARTALFNWLYAKHYGGEFLLRIEDTDKARSTDESTRAIFEGLEWLGLNWDEDVTYQGANLERHQRDARLLLERGKAYRCFCTAAELEQRRKEAESRKEVFRYDGRCLLLGTEEIERRVASGDPYTIRFRVPGGSTSWNDLVHGEITFPNKDIDDLVVLRSDGTPIYNLAVVSDDIAMGITLVMRGDDHISNTPKQIMLYEALGAKLPTFAHLPMIHGTDGKKLSKRHGATAVGDYQHMGILPETMLNFLALLGWSPGNDIELMSMDEMVQLFSTDHLLKKAAVFDPVKLDWMNGQHLSRASAERLLPVVVAGLGKTGLATPKDVEQRRSWFLSLIDLLKVRSRTVDDIVRQSAPYLRDEITYDADAVAKQWKDRDASARMLAAVRERLATATDWSPAALEELLRQLAESLGVGAGKLFQPLRLALTGQTVSAGIFDVLQVLGRDRSLDRIDAAVRFITKRDAA
ncbi:MAG TPA: glutamate--tRNA ligase [Gemmatimonadaceae bacterium]|nr:glutamate--tRNA ligase [Gemmatimonadaceae bacterium]